MQWYDGPPIRVIIQWYNGPPIGVRMQWYDEPFHWGINNGMMMSLMIRDNMICQM